MFDAAESPAAATPTIPALGYGHLTTTLVGELRVNLSLHAPCWGVPALYVVASGPDRAGLRDMHRWTSREYPHTTEGRDAAHARYLALVAASGAVQA